MTSSNSNTEELAAAHCSPCAEGSPAMDAGDAGELLAALDGWSIQDGHHLQRSWEFKDFVAALAFVNRVGEVAEAQQHHPDSTLAWGRVEVCVHTHTVGGLSRNDFILAARIDQLRR